MKTFMGHGEVHRLDSLPEILRASNRVLEGALSGTRADRQQLVAALEFTREGDVLIVTCYRVGNHSGGCVGATSISAIGKYDVALLMPSSIAATSLVSWAWPDSVRN